MIPNKSDHLGISLAKTLPHTDHEEVVVLWRKELGREALGHVDICESLALNPCRHCYSPTPFICGASEPGSPMSPSARCYIWKRRGGQKLSILSLWAPLETNSDQNSWAVFFWKAANREIGPNIFLGVDVQEHEAEL